jgi:hypothetical protein
MTYRSGWSPALPIFIGAWFVVIAVMLLVLAPEWPVKLAAAGVNLAIAAFCFFRFAAIGPRLDGDGVMIVRLFTTRRVPWSQVRRFVVLTHPGAGMAAHLERTDGEFIWLQGVGSSNAFASKASVELEVAVEAMNAERRRYQRAD